MYFPTVCVDNFFSDPYSIKKLAEEVTYNNSSNTYPGLRSDYLHQLDPNLFDAVCKKILSLFYNLKENNQLSWVIRANFQRIDPFNGSEFVYPDGWVHIDNNYILAGLIYLNSDVDAGTSIFTPKNIVAYPIHDEVKRNFYSGQPIDVQHYNSCVAENNNQYEETVFIKSKFNRIIMYDGSQPHCAKNIMRLTEPRYTLVFFVSKLQADTFPIPQSRLIHL